MSSESSLHSIRDRLTGGLSLDQGQRLRIEVQRASLLSVGDCDDVGVAGGNAMQGTGVRWRIATRSDNQGLDVLRTRTPCTLVKTLRFHVPLPVPFDPTTPTTHWFGFEFSAVDASVGGPITTHTCSERNLPGSDSFSEEWAQRLCTFYLPRAAQPTAACTVGGVVVDASRPTCPSCPPSGALPSPGMPSRMSWQE
jgi:hypothetical protein